MSTLVRILLQAIAAFAPCTNNDKAASMLAAAILRADDEGSMGHLLVAVAINHVRPQIAELQAERESLARVQ